MARNVAFLSALLPVAAAFSPFTLHGWHESARGLRLLPRSRPRGPAMDAGQRESANVPRRSALSHAAAVGVGALAGAAVTAPGAAGAAISADAEWPLWPALPVAPYSRRKTVRREVGPNVWAFDQFIGIYYVHVPIRMTVIAMESGGLFVYAPVAATRECLALLQPLIDAHGPVKHIVLPAVAVEHKVRAERNGARAHAHVCVCVCVCVCVHTHIHICMRRCWQGPLRDDFRTQNFTRWISNTRSHFPCPTGAMCVLAHARAFVCVCVCEC